MQSRLWDRNDSYKLYTCPARYRLHRGTDFRELPLDMATALRVRFVIVLLCTITWASTWATRGSILTIALGRTYSKWGRLIILYGNDPPPPVLAPSGVALDASTTIFESK